jgi:hypothetical protein
MTRFDPLKFVEVHGAVLVSAKGTLPNLADAIAGETIRGSWWGHPKGSEIFHALGRIAESPDVLCFRLVQGKLTFVHRRLWPALTRLAEVIGTEALTAIAQEHTERGAHRNVSTRYPEWVPADVKKAGQRLPESEARAMLVRARLFRE